MRGPLARIMRGLQRAALVFGSFACQMLPDSDELLDAMAWKHPGCRFARQRPGSRVFALVGWSAVC